MFARSTTPSLIVMGTSHMLTMAWACDTANAVSRRASGMARDSSLNVRAAVLGPTRPTR